ncbi:MAG: hypothetical protein IT258_22250 [Saprospiraceae bacterium]|nr:hypothetical protein [Saprospiraceae bacterium]
MENNTEAKVRDLVTDFKLDEALDLLIAQAQTQNQRKQNALLVLKGKLAMLEEQNLAGMLAHDEVARQKAIIAHQILDIADGSPLDFEITQPEQVLVQKTVSVPTTTTSKSTLKLILIGAFLLAAILTGIFIVTSNSNKTQAPAEPTLPKQDETVEDNTTPTTPELDKPVRVLDFPNIKKPFNFLDFVYEFAWAEAERISDSEIRLKIRCYITCKSNLGICYRANLRLSADGTAIDPTEQSNAVGWVEHGATISDDLIFVLPDNKKEFMVELSRDNSTWKRPFKILSK